MSRHPGFVILVCILASCRGRMYKQPTQSMAETIRLGETFYVSPSKEYSRNDIVVFDFFGDDYSQPMNDEGIFRKSWQKWVKRVIAMSGDVLEIKNADVFINREHTKDPVNSLMDYDILGSVMLDDLPQREDWEQVFIEKRGDTFYHRAALTIAQAEDYKRRKSQVFAVRKQLAEFTEGDTSMAGQCADCKWTVDNYGPLKIPAIGDTIIITPSNLRLYQNIEGIALGKHLVNEKMYFVMGDNRHRSMDSRFIGFIPHSKMVGIVK